MDIKLNLSKYLIFSNASALSVMHRLQNNQPLENLYVEKQIADSQTKIPWTRIKWAAESCINCHTVEFHDLYCNTTVCDFYEKKTNISYYCDAAHVNNYGASKIFPLLSSFLNKLSI